MPTWNATRNGASPLHPTLCRRVWPRRLTFGALNSSSRFCLSTSATVVIDVHAAAKYGTKSLQQCTVTQHFRDRRGAALRRHRNRA